MENESPDIQAVIEALLFVSDEPVSSVALARILELEPGDVESAIAQLATDYREGNRGIQLREVAGGWRFYSHPAYHEIIEKYVLSWDTRKLSQAALEALAVVAYHQPVARAGVNAVRGVNSEGVISSLIEKGLVREIGRDPGPGNAILYGTTRTFLEKFGLKSIKDLPPLEDFAPDDETRQRIRDRLGASAMTPTIEYEDDLMDPLDSNQNMVVSLQHEDGTPIVEDYDAGEDGAAEDPELMANIIQESMTEKVDFHALDIGEEDDLELVD